MKRSFYILFAFIISIMVGCTPKIIIDYMTISVPEEGGTKFIQYTKEEEKIVGPLVIKNTESGKIQWYAAPMIALSKDGKKLAYIAESNNFNNLLIKNTEGGKSTIQRTFNRNVNDMCFSPDNTKISFSSTKGNNSDVFMQNAYEGAAVQQVAASTANELGPSFTHDGKSIFYTKQEGGRYYIWSVDLKSSLQTQYSEGFTPVLSPDATSLYITRNSKDGARGEIWMIDIEKGTETQILSDPAKGFSSPDISPDGELLVVVGITPAETNKQQNLDIFTIKIDGTGLKQHTFHQGHDVSPQWTPSGDAIYFISQRGNANGEYNVWKMNFKK